MSQTVLVVDDDPIFRDIVVAVIQRDLPGVATLTAAGGAEAIATLDAGAKVDVIVCDLYMPDLDGIEFMKALRQRRQRPPIILISAAPNSIMSAAGILGSADGLSVVAQLTKPLNLNEFVKRLSAALAA